MPPDTSRAQTHTSSTKERKGGHGISGHQKQYGREGHESEGLRPLETSDRQGGCKPDTALHESQELPSYRCGWLHGTTIDVRRRSKGRTIYLACVGRNLRCHCTYIVLTPYIKGYRLIYMTFDLVIDSYCDSALIMRYGQIVMGPAGSGKVCCKGW